MDLILALAIPIGSAAVLAALAVLKIRSRWGEIGGRVRTGISSGQRLVAMRAHVPSEQDKPRPPTTETPARVSAPDPESGAPPAPSTTQRSHGPRQVVHAPIRDAVRPRSNRGRRGDTGSGVQGASPGEPAVAGGSTAQKSKSSSSRRRNSSTIAVDPLETPLDARRARITSGAIVHEIEVAKTERTK